MIVLYYIYYVGILYNIYIYIIHIVIISLFIYKYIYCIL